MADEIEKQKEIEQKLAASWYNFNSDYLWNFERADNEGSKRLIVTDEIKPTPHVWYLYYNVTYVNEDNIFLDLWFVDYISKHRIKLLADNLLEIQNPPIDNASNKKSITIHKV